jgi:ubiquinone/menaquinone biosynthesis C-methylase UbiE
VAVTAARLGACVTGIDFTPELLNHARENARTANVDVELQEGDVEQLPFNDASFHVVLSQYGHIFPSRPDVAVAEMLRVLKHGGTIAFST